MRSWPATRRRCRVRRRTIVSSAGTCSRKAFGTKRTTNPAAFLRAVADHPDEDGPRLVLADWLDERGDAARAEFVRVQCAAAALPAFDDRRVGLEDRADDL